MSSIVVYLVSTVLLLNWLLVCVVAYTIAICKVVIGKNECLGQSMQEALNARYSYQPLSVPTKPPIRSCVKYGFRLSKK